MKKIDVHAHYGRWPFAGRDASVADMMAILKKHDIEAFFLSSAKAIQYDFVEGNRELFEAIADVDGLFGYVYVNANYIEESISEVRKYCRHPKFIGVKIHPDYAGRPPDCEGLLPLYELAGKLEVPVLIHTWGEGDADPRRLANINRRYPEVRLIAAHMGGDRPDLGAELAGMTNGNVYLEICSTCVAFDKIRSAVEAAGIERVLFGTDYSLFDPSFTIGAVESADLTDKQREFIYYKNALRLFARYPGNGDAEFRVEEC